MSPQHRQAWIPGLQRPRLPVWPLCHPDSLNGNACVPASFLLKMLLEWFPSLPTPVRAPSLTLQKKSLLSVCRTPGSLPDGRPLSRHSGKSEPERQRRELSRSRHSLHSLSTRSAPRKGPPRKTASPQILTPKAPPLMSLCPHCCPGYCMSASVAAHHHPNLDVGILILFFFDGWWRLLGGLIGQDTPPAKGEGDIRVVCVSPCQIPKLQAHWEICALRTLKRQQPTYF